jgi:cadmium resistance transport/sequestration family protein
LAIFKRGDRGLPVLSKTSINETIKSCQLRAKLASIYRMSWLFAVIIAGISSFVATNIDDIILLMLFFSQVSDRLRPRHIIIGQYLGFSVLILASLPGLLGGLIIPHQWIGLLGIVPIIIGIKQLLSKDENEGEEVIQTVSAPAVISSNKPSSNSLLSKFFNRQTYSVAAITVANGGDNIGIYVPLFASGDLLSFSIILIIFYIFIGIWCAIAYLLSRQPTVGKLLARYGNAIVPFVLISLGIYILIENKTYQLIKLF